VDAGFGNDHAQYKGLGRDRDSKKSDSPITSGPAGHRPATKPTSRRIHQPLTILDGFSPMGRLDGALQGLIKVDGTFV
jgi:hypothetical protein